MKFNVGDRVVVCNVLNPIILDYGVIRKIVPNSEYPYRVSLNSWMDDDFLFLCKEEELEGIE